MLSPVFDAERSWRLSRSTPPRSFRWPKPSCGETLASSSWVLAARGRCSLQATLGVEQGDVLALLLFAVAFRRPVERLREILVTTLVAGHDYSCEDTESEVVFGAYLDDVLVWLPAPLAAQVPPIAAQAFAPAGRKVEQQKTKVWVPAGLCPAGVSARW